MVLCGAVPAPVFAAFTYLVFHSLAGCSVQAQKSANNLQSLLVDKVLYEHRTPFADAPKLADVGPPDGCTPKFLYLVARHGTRWETNKKWMEMKDLEPIIAGAPNVKDHPWVKDWKLPFEDGDGNLHPIGTEELRDLAARLQVQFPKLLGQPYSPVKYHFQSTESQRAIDSASAFATGLFAASDDGPLKQEITIDRNPLDEDTLLLHYSTNSTFRDKASQRGAAAKEWAHNAVYKRIARSIERNLGYSKGELDGEFVSAMWNLCQMQASLQNEVGEACSLFSRKALLDVNWVSDSEVSQSTGVAIDDRCSVAKPLASDILLWLKTAASPKQMAKQTSGQLARFHFGHRDTIYPLFCTLGINNQPMSFEDGLRNPPPFSVLNRNINNRFWRVSRIAPNSGNLLAVLYDCGSDMKVRLVWNEQVVSGDWCDGTECKLSEVIDRLEKRIGI